MTYRFEIRRFEGPANILPVLARIAEKQQATLGILVNLDFALETNEWIVWYDFDTEEDAVIFKLTHL